MFYFGTIIWNISWNCSFLLKIVCYDPEVALELFNDIILMNSLVASKKQDILRYQQIHRCSPQEASRLYPSAPFVTPYTIIELLLEKAIFRLVRALE